MVALIYLAKRLHKISGFVIGIETAQSQQPCREMRYVRYDGTTVWDTVDGVNVQYGLSIQLP